MRQAGGEMVPLACVGLSMLCYQLGAALVTPLFASVGAQGASALRLSLAACIMNAALRPWRGDWNGAWLWTLGYGIGLAGLNLFFYFAIRTVPLGVTVAIEFIGPLSVAVASSRRLADLLWAGLAGAGMLCLLPVAGLNTAIDPVGVGYALLSAASWVVYILCGQRAGRSGLGTGVAAAGGAIAAVVVLPVGIAHAGRELLHPDVLKRGLAVAIISGCLPYGLEMVGLRRLPPRLFGILMSLEPAVGAFFGSLLLGQYLTPLQGLAIGAVVAASVGSSLTARVVPSSS